jgi:hypothetical protein
VSQLVVPNDAVPKQHLHNLTPPLSFERTRYLKFGYFAASNFTFQALHSL